MSSISIDTTVSTYPMLPASPTAGMVVEVTNSGGIAGVAHGPAGYKWDALNNRWLLIWIGDSTHYDFITEEVSITSGTAITTHPIANGLVWGCKIKDGNTTIASVSYTQSDIVLDQIAELTPAYEGKTLLVSYSYTIKPAIPYSAIETPFKIVTTDYLSTSGDCLLADTFSGSFTVTLPGSPIVGSKVKIIDARSNFKINPVYIEPNNKLITGTTNTIALDMTDNAVIMVYSGDTFGWVFG